ncbi:MAG: peptide ABC transporter substrate-binding protein, partial [Candidatus Methanosuratincola sp.]
MPPKSLKLLVIALVFLLAATSCRSGEGSTPPTRDSLRVNLASEPPTLDWTLARDATSITVITNLMQGLTQFGKGFRVEPSLAEGWDVSRDGREYTFYLRRDVRWTDGVPLKAGDFVYSWRRLLDPATGADYAYFLYDIENARAFNSGLIKDPSVLGFKARDDHTLTVRLSHPASYFPSLLTFVSTYPLREDVLERHGASWTKPENIVTLGPYRLAEWRHHERITLVRNLLYWGEPPKIDRVEMIMSGNPSAALALYESGELDFLDGKDIPTLEVPRLRKSPEFVVTSQFRGNYIGFNVRKPPFSNPLVRRAFSAAIDRKRLVELIQGAGIPDPSWIPRGMLGYSPEVGIKYDPEQARRWLAEAGYPEGRGFPEVEFLYPDVGNNRIVAQALQSMWKKTLGVTVKLNNQEWKVYLSTLKTDPPELWRAGWGADFPDPHNFMNLFECSSGNNHTGWCNERYDRIIEEGAREQDPARRKALYVEAQKILVEEDVPIAPIYTSIQYSMVKPYVKGLKINELSLL